MCGIIGFSGKDKQNYNIEKLKLLLYSNSIERKSTDSTGFYFKGIKDNIPVKSIINAKDFIGNNNIFKLLEPSSMFIGHVRSKSVGNNTIVNAHPYKIGNIIGVHNGTITNIESISNKYANEYYGNKTDSYNLFNSLYIFHKTNPLSKIIGGTAVLFTDTMEEDTLYVYRNEDRDLFYTVVEEGMYISSEKNSLKMISNGNEILLFECGTFYAIKNSEIIKSFKILTKVAASNNATNQKYPARFGNKWVYCTKNNDFDKLKAGEWYLTDNATTYQANNTYFTIIDGMLSNNKKVKEKITHVTVDHFDLNLNYLPFAYSEVDGRIIKFMYTILDKNNNILAEIGDYGIINSKNYQSDKYKVYVPLRDEVLTSIDETDMRICSVKEEDELGTFLTTIEEESGNEFKNIKFTTIDEELLNEKLIEFNKKIILELDILAKSKKDIDIKDFKIKIKEFEEELKNIS